MKKEIKWENDGFELRLFAPTPKKGNERQYCSYELKDNGKVIFTGDKFSPSPMHEFTEKAIPCILGFLTMRPGFDDSEYFKDHKYTKEQMKWARGNRCEDLGMIASDLEEIRATGRIGGYEE